MLAIVEDISKRKEAEEKLAKVNADILNEKYKLEAILQDMGDAVFVTDEDKKIVLVNRAMENLFGLSEKEMYGKKIEETLALSYETTGEKPVDLIKSVFEKKRQAKPVSSLVIKHKSGQSVLVDGVASPILDAGGVLKGTVWVLRDVSKEKELEKMRIDFISLASHQLRTPLTGIKWFVELLQEDASKIPMDKVQEYIKRIGESSSRMVDLVNDLLTTSRADSGKLVKDVGNYSVKDLFQQAVEAQDRVFTDKKIRVEGVSEISSDLEIDADVVQMEQVLGNLLNNAACYSPPGSKIEIKVEQIGEKIRITVKDHGIGIPVSQQSKVFEKFFRANNVAGTIPGTGLGLYVAKSMVESHGGKIWFESKENEGTTFFVELPIKQKNEKKKVMIVEDDTVLANALKLALENEGYELSLATDGEEAERMIQLEIPDLILLDLLLPIKNGFEVLKVMRQNPSTKDISVVILTNFEQETSINEGKKLGAKDYIVKANIDIQDVPEIVKKYLPA